MMKELIELLNSKRVNCSRGWQKALREIDMDVLVRILNGLDEKYHKYFFRNLSEKTKVILKKEMEIQKELLKSSYNGMYDGLDEDVKNFCSILRIYTNENFDKQFDYPPYTEKVNFDNMDSTIDTFYHLGDYARRNGLMALNDLIDSTDNDLFNKSLELLLVGIDPFLFDELLENYMKLYLERKKKIYTMIIKGIRGLYDGDHPEMIKERLNSISI